MGRSVVAGLVAQMVSVSGQNQVIGLPIAGKILYGVVNDPVCPKRARHVQVSCTAHDRDLTQVSEQE